MHIHFQRGNSTIYKTSVTRSYALILQKHAICKTIILQKHVECCKTISVPKIISITKTVRSLFTTHFEAKM
jgi:hypothetical protein